MISIWTGPQSFSVRRIPASQPPTPGKKFNRRPIVPTLFQAPTGCEKLSCDATYGQSNYFRCDTHRILPMMMFGVCLCSIRWRTPKR